VWFLGPISTQKTTLAPVPIHFSIAAKLLPSFRKRIREYKREECGQRENPSDLSDDGNLGQIFLKRTALVGLLLVRQLQDEQLGQFKQCFDFSFTVRR
jgi:hypothetical protein